MSTQLAPAPAHPAPLDADEFKPQTMFIKNVSPREYLDSYSSVIYRFKPGQTLEIKEQLGAPSTEWGVQDISKIKSFALPHGHPDGTRAVDESSLEVRKGGDLKHVWKFLSDKPGCPLVRLRFDGNDPQREREALKRFAAERLRAARYTIDQHQKHVARAVTATGNIPEKPAEVWEAEEDIRNLSRNASGKRYQITFDGARFDTMDEAKAYILDPLRHPEYQATWSSFVRDTHGGALERPLHVSENIGQTVAPVAQPAPVAPPIQEVSGPSPAAQKIIGMAEDSGRPLPDHIAVRLDDANDVDAVKDAMEYIMSVPDEDDEPAKPRRGRPRKTDAAPKAE